MPDWRGYVGGAASDARSRSPTSSPGSSPSGDPCPAGPRRGRPDDARARGRAAEREADAMCRWSRFAALVHAAVGIAPRIPLQARPRAERARRRPGRHPGARLHPRARSVGWAASPGSARPGRELPGRRDAAGDLREPVPRGLGRRDGEDRLLGAPHQGRAVPGLRDQLRAPRLPGALVRAVAAVHVPLPRRRLLRGRRARLGAAAAGPLRVRVPGPRRPALGARRPAPDARRARCEATARRWPRLPFIGRVARGARGARAQRSSPVLAHPRPASHRELVVRLRQRHARPLRAPDRHGHLPGAGLRARRPTRRTRACST